MAPPPSKRNGCLIALLVIGVLGLVLMAILAAIALPAYQDYVKRAKAAQIRQTGGDGTFDAARLNRTEALARELVTVAMRTSYAANASQCPDEYEFEQAMVRDPRLQGDDDGWFSLDPTSPAGGVCAYRVEFRGLGPETKGHAVQYEVVLDGDDVRISCHNLDMPVGAIPSRCGA
jgi:type II secretory pathway pseudopilin PulG